MEAITKPIESKKQFKRIYNTLWLHSNRRHKVKKEEEGWVIYAKPIKRYKKPHEKYRSARETAIIEQEQKVRKFFRQHPQVKIDAVRDKFPLIPRRRLEIWKNEEFYFERSCWTWKKRRQNENSNLY